MEKIIKYTILIVLFHFIVAGIHGVAHQIIPIPLSILQYLFVISIITISPIVAVVLLQKKIYDTGIALLFGSMLGALVFGVYNHFVVISPDHISQIPTTNWGKIFKITAYLLMILETLGAVIGLWGLIKKEKPKEI